MAFQLYDLQVDSTDHKLALLVFKNNGASGTSLIVNTLSVTGTDATSFTFPALADVNLDADAGTDEPTLIGLATVTDLQANIVTFSGDTYLDIPVGDQSEIGFSRIYLKTSAELLAGFSIVGQGSITDGYGYATVLMFHPEINFGACSATLTVDTSGSDAATYALTGSSSGDALYEWALADGSTATSFTYPTTPMGISLDTTDVQIQIDADEVQPNGIEFEVTSVGVSSSTNGTVSMSGGTSVSAGSPKVFTYTPIATTAATHNNTITAVVKLDSGNVNSTFGIVHSFANLFSTSGVANPTINIGGVPNRNSTATHTFAVSYRNFSNYPLSTPTAVPFDTVANGGIFDDLGDGIFDITGWGPSSAGTHTGNMDLSGTQTIWLEVTFSPTAQILSPTQLTGSTILSHNNDIHITDSTYTINGTYNPIPANLRADCDVTVAAQIMEDPSTSGDAVSALYVSNVKTIEITNTGDLTGTITGVTLNAAAGGYTSSGNQAMPGTNSLAEQLALVNQLTADLAAAVAAHDQPLEDELTHQLAVATDIYNEMLADRSSRSISQTSYGTYDEDQSWGFYLVDNATSSDTVANTAIATDLTVTVSPTFDSETQVAPIEYYIVFWAVPDSSQINIEGEYTKKVDIAYTQSDGTAVTLTHDIAIVAGESPAALSLQDLDGDDMVDLNFGTVGF